MKKVISKVKNFRFFKEFPTCFDIHSDLQWMSFHDPWWFEVKDNPTCRGLWLPAKCGIGHGVFGVKVRLMTRHDTSFFKVEDVGWPETLEGRMPVAAWPRLNRRWIKAMTFKLSAVMRIRRILRSWYFEIFWIVVEYNILAATSITTVSCTSCICHPSAPIPTFASPYLIIFFAMSSCTLHIPTGLFRANARRHWSGCKMHEAGEMRNWENDYFSNELVLPPTRGCPKKMSSRHWLVRFWWFCTQAWGKTPAGSRFGVAVAFTWPALEQLLPMKLQE